jgi:exodeoxyribonuclease VII small subunit
MTKAAATSTDTPDPIPADIAALGYEQARDALVDVVRQLEAGSATLEQSLALWERGEALARHCEGWLAGARQRLDAVSREPTPD